MIIDRSIDRSLVDLAETEDDDDDDDCNLLTRWLTEAARVESISFNLRLEERQSLTSEPSRVGGSNYLAREATR